MISRFSVTGVLFALTIAVVFAAAPKRCSGSPRAEVRKGTVMVPVGDFCRRFGISLHWDAVTYKATAATRRMRAEFRAGSGHASVNGTNSKLSVAPYLSSGSLVVPLRVLTQAFGGTVESQQDESRAVVYIGQMRWKVDLAPQILSGRPSIRITQVPPYGGGSDSWGDIAGYVSGVDPSKHYVVVYAGTDSLYVQPYTAAPYTQIQRNGRWSTGTHLGWVYHALLVKRGYTPRDIADSLPRRSRMVLAVTSARPRR